MELDVFHPFIDVRSFKFSAPHTSALAVSFSTTSGSVSRAMARSVLRPAVRLRGIATFGELLRNAHLVRDHAEVAAALMRTAESVLPQCRRVSRELRDELDGAHHRFMLHVPPVSEDTNGSLPPAVGAPAGAVTARHSRAEIGATIARRTPKLTAAVMRHDRAAHDR
jgi:hypothetical protein